MELTRNLTPDGTQKYAIVRLDKINQLNPSFERGEIDGALRILEENGVLEYGRKGTNGEFFVLKLQDRFTAGALERYAQDVFQFAQRYDRNDLKRYAEAMFELADRAYRHPHRKVPDTFQPIAEILKTPYGGSIKTGGETGGEPLRKIPKISQPRPDANHIKESIGVDLYEGVAPGESKTLHLADDINLSDKKGGA
jgi:hypothetical protein